MQHRSRVAIDPHQPNLRQVHRDESGSLVRLAGIMAIVLCEGAIFPGDTIEIERPNAPHQPLAPV